MVGLLVIKVWCLAGTALILNRPGGPAIFSGDCLHEVHAHLDIEEGFDLRLLEATLLDARFAAEDITTIMAQMRAQRAYVVARSGD